MKRNKPFVNLHNKCGFNSGIRFLLIFLICYGTAQGKSEFSELVSLNIRNAPLAEVLDKVSQASGYEFIIDENWYDLPISVTFDAIPLEQALKRILANVNHAIVYNSDRRVLIRIFENDSSISRNTGTSTINRYPHRPAYQSPLNESPTSPNPVPPEPSAEETETEESDMSSRQSEAPEEEDENEDNDTSEEEDDEENLEEEGVNRQ
jgi:type II secretory pathway component GspD/PulD (secretin)